MNTETLKAVINQNRREAIARLTQNNRSPVVARAYVSLANWFSAKLRAKRKERTQC